MNRDRRSETHCFTGSGSNAEGEAARFPAAYKKNILAEMDAAAGSG